MEKFHSIPKLKFHVMLFILTVISFTGAFLFTPTSITTYASDGSMTEQESPGQAVDGLGTGISYRHTGWLFYLVYPDGTEASNVMATESYDYGITTDTGEPVANIVLVTINGTGCNHDTIETNAPWGPPFDSAANFRGDEVHQWLMSDPDGDGHTNAAGVIKQWFGESWALQWESKELYLCFEPFYWARLIKDGKTTGYWYCATAPRWGMVQNRLGINADDMGDPLTNRYTNNVFPNCVTLEDCPEIQAMGLNAPTHGGYLSNTEMYTRFRGRATEGYGIGIVWNEVEQSTCDEPLIPAPHPAPNESTGTTTIIKSYRTRNTTTNTLTDDGTYTRSNLSNQITIEDETNYRVVAWKTSTSLNSSISSLTWESSVPATIGSTGTSTGSVTLSTTQKYLYVLLEKSNTPIIEPLDTDYKLGESQITRRISLSTNDRGEALLSSHAFTWNYGALDGQCGGHTTYCDGCEDVGHDSTCPPNCTVDHGRECPGHTTYCSWSLDDTSWSFHIKNDKFTSYPKNIAATSFWSDKTDGVKNETRDDLGSGSIEETFDYSAVLHRGSDPLTIAKWKNANAPLESLDSFTTGNSKTANRKTADYTESISFEFTDSSDDLSTSSKGDKDCTNTDTASLNAPFSVDIDILYETYSGSEETVTNTEINTSEMLTIGTVGNTIASGRMVNSGLTFSFHPYIQMRYDTIDTTDNLAYVLGEYKRTLTPNDYAEIIWKKSDTENLTLSSAQWSTHAQATADKGAATVLPGGATLNIGIKQSDRQTITVRTYQTILDGAGREQVELTSGSVAGYTKQSALQYHQSYVDSVIEGLESLTMTQWVNGDDTANPFDGVNTYMESDISSLNNGSSKSSSEAKYYFTSDSDQNLNTEGDIDVKVGTTITQYFTFSSDASGNILMNGSVVLTKDQGISSLSGTAKSINDRTLIITKLLDALERNSGNDAGATWVSDGHWYNEIFDGITAAVSTTKLTTGFVNPTERMVVQDPKLNTKSYGQKYLFKDKDKNPSYNVCAFKMNDYTELYNSKYTVGLFKGYPVKMKDMDMLYYSRNYYISNITTQDLK